MTFTDSAVKSATASALSGVWLHDVTDPAGTLAQYRYGNTDRSEVITVDGTNLSVLGREYPIVEFGIAEDNSVNLSTVVPYETLTDDSALADAFRRIVSNRNTMVYRDNRGRLIYGVITDMSITDEAWGYTASFKIIATNYLEGLN